MPFLTKEKTNWKFILIVLILAILVSGGILYFYFTFKEKERLPIILQPKEIIIFTDKKEYEYVGEPEGAIKFTIKNSLNKSICLDSCNTYYRLKKKDNDWERLDIKICQFSTVAECIKSGETKVFEYITTWKESGIYKIAIPICIDCEKSKGTFREDKVLYSNEFQIKEKKIEEKTVNWKTYRSEEYGFEFEYPKEWGSLTFQSQEGEVYIFKSESEKAETILYHKPSGVIVFVEKGEKYKLVYGGENYQDILKVIHPNKEIKTIYTVSPDQVEWYGKIDRINISPNGKYISFILSAYEYSQPIMVNIETGKNIFEGLLVWFSDPNKSIFWSPNNEVLAIKSETNDFSGEGICGLFVSDWRNLEKLNKVFSVPNEKHLQGIHVNNVHFLDNEKVFFEIGEGIEKYIYNAKTKELTKIK